MEILLQIHSLFGHIDQAYLNAAKVGGWIVGIIAAVTYVVRQMIKVVAGVTKIKDHFEANQEFRGILSNTPGFEGLRPNKKGFSIKFEPLDK